MNRLQTELHRLYLLPAPQPGCEAPEYEALSLIGTEGQVRAMVLEVAQSTGWDAVATLWQGVQDDFDLPAPAIAVSGVDGFQIWFSLAEPVSVAQALDFLDSLRLRFLSALTSKRIVMKPNAAGSAPQQAQHARMVPDLQPETGQWSAFVAPGLASMFATEPWLDQPPSPEAQASLLSRFASIKPADFKRVQERLRPTRTPVERTTGLELAAAQDAPDPKHFLLGVMNDPAIELRLRIEAAKALLPYFERDIRSTTALPTQYRPEVPPPSTAMAVP
jgi:hypothetical protein